METFAEVLIILVVLTNLKLLGSSRATACIRTVAAQGVLLAALPLVTSGDAITLRMIAQALVSGTLKAFVLPFLLLRATRGARAGRELAPFVGYTTSILLGVALMPLALALGRKLGVTGPAGADLLAPAALFTLLVGLLIIVCRKQAVTLVVGYLAMENGIYAMGLAFAQREPLLVEMGILLDVFAAVFVMGLVARHIHREFDTLDTDRLSSLKG
ncbi:MAG: hydrogenase [Verrucomicrobiae bacterium]|nr:hydrogenase [Verrucomicrobiae bacterium]